MCHCRDLNSGGLTLFVGEVVEGIAKRGKVSVADEEAIGDAVKEDEEGEVMTEGEDECGETDAEDGDKGDDAVGEGECLEVAAEHADVGHDDGEGVDDRQLADVEAGLPWINPRVPW
jgi:hypothetical protein